MMTDGDQAHSLSDPELTNLRSKVTAQVDKALESLPPIRETIRLLQTDQLDLNFDLDDPIECLRMEKEHLNNEISESRRILELQLEIISNLNRHQGSLQQILTKYKRKSAARLESAVALGKRNRNEIEKDTSDFQCEAMPMKSDIGVQCFDFLNECGEDVNRMREEEREFNKTMEEAFKLLLVGRYTNTEQDTNKKQSGSDNNASRKAQQDARQAKNKRAVDIESAEDNDGSVVFDGNMSPTFSDKEMTDEKKKRRKDLRNR